MPREEQTINVNIKKTAYRFLKRCEQLGFARIDLEIKDGLPKTIYRGVVTERMDIDIKDNLTD